MFILTNLLTGPAYPRTFCTDGQFHGNHAVGPLGFRPKLWKTEAGALRYARRIENGSDITVHVEVAS